MSMPDYSQLHAIVRGRVQGVNFRYYTVQQARKLELTGWVRNRRDRTVEVLAEGSRQQLDALVEFLHRGSPSSDVTAVDVKWGIATNAYFTFGVRYDAD